MESKMKTMKKLDTNNVSSSSQNILDSNDRESPSSKGLSPIGKRSDIESKMKTKKKNDTNNVSSSSQNVLDLSEKESPSTNKTATVRINP